jgi:MoxR-like ATPase
VTVVTQTPQQTAVAVREILAQVERVIIGKSEALETVLLGVLAGGHVLIEDPPGLGKTVLAGSPGCSSPRTCCRRTSRAR